MGSSHENNQDTIKDIVERKTACRARLYKSNVGGSEEVSLAASYVATFYNTPKDPTEADFEFNSDDVVGPKAFLLVTDGRNSPGWYSFDLTAWSWNGKETLLPREFWPDGGASSSVGLCGSTQSVPEPNTMVFLGCGILVLGAVGGRKLRKEK